MINIGKILKRSWHILWNYRVLWAFGLLLAITTGGGGGGNGGGSNSSYSPGNDDFPRTPSYQDAPEWVRAMGEWFEQIEPVFTSPGQHVTTWVLIGVAIVLFILIVSLIVALIRYPSETAVMRMVDDYEQTGNKVGFRQGWKLGWSRRAFHLWVIDLILGLPGFAFLLVMLIVGLMIYFSVTSGAQALSVIGTVAAIGIFFMALFIFIIFMVFLGLLRNFFARAAALEETGVIESFRSGWATFKSNWKSAGLMWLVMIGISIAFGILAVIAFFLLIPAYLILLLPAGAVAFLPGLLAFAITSLFASFPLALLIGLLVALPFFFMVLFSPLLLISGWFKIYESSVWTLTYREIKALASVNLPLVASENAQL
jgi:hypothetical protein